MTSKRGRPWWTKITRDLVLFTAGLAGVFHQTVVRSVPNPAALGAFLVMMGLTPVIRADERRRERTIRIVAPDED